MCFNNGKLSVVEVFVGLQQLRISWPDSIIQGIRPHQLLIIVPLSKDALKSVRRQIITDYKIQEVKRILRELLTNDSVLFQT